MSSINSVKSEYERLLADARVSKSGQLIGNRYPWHCKIAVAELVNEAIDRQKNLDESHAPTQIQVLTGTFSDHVYGGKVAKQLASFLNLGGQVKLFLWSEKIPESSSIKKLQQAGKFDVLCSGTTELADELSHFFLVDKDAYRLERPHGEFTSSQFSDFEPEIPATICFNGSKIGGELDRFFHDVWQVSAGTGESE